MDQKKMKSKRYSAIEAAAKIIEMESHDSDYDVQMINRRFLGQKTSPKILTF